VNDAFFCMKLAFLTTDNRQAHQEYDNPVPWFGTAPEALLQGFTGLPGLEVHVVTCTQRAMPSPAKLAENIHFHSLHVPKLGWMRTLYEGCVRATRRKLREIQPDLVHGQGTERDCSISAVRSGFPSVLTIHGNMRVMAKMIRARPFSFYWLAARIEAFTLSRAQGVVCITKYTQQMVESCNRRTWVVPNAVDGSFFDLGNEPATPPTILCVGTVDPRKNQNAFIRALDPLAGQRAFRVVFLGAAKAGVSYSAEFLELVRARPWCEFAGFADRATLKSWFVAASALVLPSHEDNCPMVVLEAMAAGVPVAAARVGGVPELIRDGETGLMFDPNEAQDMRRAVTWLLDDHEKVLAGNAKKEALRRFLPRAIAQRHVEIYEEVLAGMEGGPTF
jgi:glycosyltransferase involved in cell wall biosynthesis